VLLLADQTHPLGRYTDQQIAQTLSVNVKTVSRIRQSFVKGGIPLALERQHRATPPIEPKLDGRGEATLVAICCSEPPSGHARWSLQLMVDELVKRKIVSSICRETVRKTLKKTNCGLGV